MGIYVGVDVGTSGLKAIAVRGEDGSALASASREYPIEIPRNGWAEQDAEAFVEAGLSALAEVAEKLGPRRDEVRAIGLAGQMHSAVLLGERDELLRRAILWCDVRTTEECRAITAKLGRDGLRRTVKNTAYECMTLPKLLWLARHEPEVLARTRTVLMPKDYLGLRLTGARVTDVSDASGTLAFDPAARAWSKELLDALGVPASIFPPALESPASRGELLPQVARRTGLPAGVVVTAGAADNAAAAVGLGVVRAGRVMASIGTSGVVVAHTDAVRVDPDMRLHAFCAAVPERSYVMGVVQTAGLALRWFRDTIARTDYDAIGAAAARSREGARGILFLPYLLGERIDASARGAFVGISADTTLDDLSRAVFEGVAFGLADSVLVMRALDPPIAPSEIRLSGGGAKSALWRQIIADVVEAPVAITTSTEGPSLGAAILAAVAAGEWPKVEDAADAWVRVVERVEPRASVSAVYREHHAQHRALYADLKERFRALA